MSKRLTTNQQEYKKQLTRIKRFVARAKKAGYIFTEEVIPDTPTRITKKQLQKIKALTANKLYSKAVWVTPYGTSQPAHQHRKEVRQQAARKAAQTRKAIAGGVKPVKQERLPRQSELVLDSVRELIERWQPKSQWSERFQQIKQNDKNILLNLLNGAINENGEEAVAKNLAHHAMRIKDLTWEIIYGASGDKKDGVQSELVEFATILKGSSLSREQAEELQDSFDQREEQ